MPAWTAGVSGGVIGIAFRADPVKSHVASGPMTQTCLHKGLQRMDAEESSQTRRFAAGGVSLQGREAEAQTPLSQFLICKVAMPALPSPTIDGGGCSKRHLRNVGEC